jgi:hypothetical protein
VYEVVEFQGKIKVIKHSRHIEVLQSRQKWMERPFYDSYELQLRRDWRKLNPLPFNKDEAAANKKRSLYRTKGVIQDLILNNEFNYWITLTFDKSKYDSSNREFVITAFRDLRRWFNLVDIKYVAVLEKHSSGGFHIHIILNAPSNFHLEHWSPAINRKAGAATYGRKLVGKFDSFNKWSYGFSNLIMVDNSYESIFKIANYLRKYMTKTLFDELGRKRYWSSKGLKRPRVVAILDPNSLVGVKFSNESVNYRRSIYKLPPSFEFYEDVEHIPGEVLEAVMKAAPPEV